MVFEFSVGPLMIAARRRDARSIVKFITLRFFVDDDHTAVKEHGVELTVPFAASWPDVCVALHKRFQRTVHFQYYDVAGAPRTVRSAQALDAFRAQLGEEGLEKGSSLVFAQVKQPLLTLGSSLVFAQAKQPLLTHLFAQVKLVPFGCGGPPIVETLRDDFSLSSSHQAPEERMQLLGCVTEALSDEARAADAARAIIQSPTGPACLMEQRDDAGRTALHLAAAQGRQQLVQALLSGPQQSRTAAACAQDYRGRTPLHYARGEQVVVLLLGAKADPLIVDTHGYGPLHLVTDPDVADRLVKAKSHGAPHDASPDLRDKVGRTALSCHAAAAWEQSGEMLSWLVLRAPACVNSDGNELRQEVAATDAFARSALHDAAAANNWQGLDVLFKSGAFAVDGKDKFGLSALHIAAKANGLKSVSLLLAKRANPDARDISGRRPVELASKDAVIRVLAQSLQGQHGKASKT